MSRKRRSQGDEHPRRSPPRIAIAFEDDHVIVVDKPAGMPTQTPRRTRTQTLLDLVNDHVHSSPGTNFRVRAINRLAPEISGLVLFAKSERAERRLLAAAKHGEFSRTYVAVVRGELRPGKTAGVIQTDDDATRRRRSTKGRTSPKDTPSKPAVTKYRSIHQTEGLSLVELVPETHRRDQLITHLASIDHPIVGSASDPRSKASETPMLHLRSLGFVHPLTGKTEATECPLPESFRRLMPSAKTDAAPEQDTSWQGVARWYSEYQTGARNDHFRDTIHPGVRRLLGSVKGQRVLDVACGEGLLASILTDDGASVVGVDAAPDLIEAARARRINRAAFVVADASTLTDLRDAPLDAPFDAACCVMAIMNIEHLDRTLRGIAQHLKHGAPFVIVMLHPAFRAPKQTSWIWERDDAGKKRQARRIDAYLSERSTRITMNPGRAAHGHDPVETITFHRPLSVYVRELARAGLMIDAMEEWPSARKSEPGPRADEENRARAEIPMFLGIRARRSTRSR